MTGYSFGLEEDFATVKYGASGNPLWAVRYDGIGASDLARDLATDSQGNLYVVGKSAKEYPQGNDFETVKYSASGIQLWAVPYDGGGGPNAAQLQGDRADAVSVDPAGNIYVAGTSHNGIDDDYAVVKYDPSGIQLWVARYDNGNYDVVKALTVDSSGNAYVTGYSLNVATNNLDYATVKYGPSGNQIWAARYNNGLNGSNPEAIAVDGFGNVYVTGESSSAPYNNDFLTIKYDSNGNPIWIARDKSQSHS